MKNGQFANIEAEWIGGMLEFLYEPKPIKYKKEMCVSHNVRYYSDL